MSNQSNSDGQKYRYRIAKLIESKKQFWVMDEFCATLDRDTAKIVAFNVQKQARRTGRCVLAATTHTDLLENLNPSVHIVKGLGKRVEVRYYPNEMRRECSVTKRLRIVEGTKKDWAGLEPWHYRGGKVIAIRKVFALKRGDSETVGAIVYAYPKVLVSGRCKAFGRRVYIKEANEKIAEIARVVLHPKYRSVGLGVNLVRETLPLNGLPYVETIAVMARYNPFFERAGMTKILETIPNKSILKALEHLKGLGFNPIYLASPKYNLKRLRRLSLEELGKVKQILLSIEPGYYKRLKRDSRPYVKKREFHQYLLEATLEQLAQTLCTVAVLSQSKVYLLWQNPAFQD